MKPIEQRVHAPIFPLPTVNLFPETVASYHIFEPRYREMLRSALEGDKLLAMGILKPGYEDEYYGTPEIYPVGCLGRIQSWEELENGTFNIVLEGLSRVGFGTIIKDNPYRVAEMQILEEVDLDGDFSEEQENILLRLNFLVENSKDEIDFSPILNSEDSFVSLINMVSKVLPMKNTERYRLLALDSIRERARKILWHIDDQIETAELLKKIDPKISDEITYH